jgi:hypothetical protein
MLHMVTFSHFHSQGQLPPFKSWALSYVREGKIIHNVITQQSRDSTLNLGSLDSPVTLALIGHSCPLSSNALTCSIHFTLFFLLFWFVVADTICFFLAVLQYG